MNNWNKQGGAAFPIPHSNEPGAYEGEPGMSLRDWFAGQALAGKMSIESIEFLSREDIADRCYRQADAMLAARGADQ